MRPVAAAELRTAGRVGAVAGQRGEAAVLAHLGAAGVLLRRGEGDRLDLEAEVVDRLLDEVGVLVADVLKLCGGDADIERLARDVREPRWLQPGLKGLAIDLLLERTEDAHPVIQYGGRRRNE